MDFQKQVDKLLASHAHVLKDLTRSELIQHTVDNKEVTVSKNGALSAVTPKESRGRIPENTYYVKRDEIVADIDWDSPNNNPLDPDTFELVFNDAIQTLGKKEKLYLSHRAIGAEPSYALPMRLITDRSLTALFADNMFRPTPKGIENSIFYKQPFTLLALPYDKLPESKYLNLLRKPKDGTDQYMVVAMDFVKGIGIVYGSAYMGSCKKLMFTVMNYLLPGKGILPIHASANEGMDGDIALFLGLSGTGKTTLSADPKRRLLGDDEHGWDANGVANFENGCYAKLIRLNPEKEPEIFQAITHDAPVTKHGAIVENTKMNADLTFDFDDDSLTENSRGSYPLNFLKSIKESSVGGHPKRILFLTADANGVLPPVARLSEAQAMLWFMMGYTSKLAGTETGITEPKSTFSRFFGEPFMPRNPEIYASMLGEKMKKFNTQVFLVNTGWSGGPYGEGKRIDIMVTRAIVSAILETDLEGVEYQEDPRFHIQVPRNFPNLNPEILNPRNTWKDKAAFDKRADNLAKQFSDKFDAVYGKKNIDAVIAACCPGK